MESILIKNLKRYIEDEERDATLYKELSNVAPNSKFRELLFDISLDEQSHAESFKKLYHSITGKNYSPIITRSEKNGSFKDILKERILEEIEAFRTYGSMIAPEKSNRFNKIFEKAKNDELAHAIMLIYMSLPS